LLPPKSGASATQTGRPARCPCVRGRSPSRAWPGGLLES